MDGNSNVYEKIIEFSWYDHTLFACMLGLSTAIGIYFGFFGKKQENADEYLLGSSEMKVFPISMSLIASYISGITLLAIPAEIYLYGAQYVMVNVGVFILCFTSNYIFLPVFYKIKITSIYEYLELRFDRKIRLITSALYSLSVLLYLPIVIYIPALAFSQATGLNVHIITPVLCGICIFYTTIGGLKAVVWTDTLQFGAMIGGIIGVIAVGLYKIGGFGNLFLYCHEGERLDFDFDINPFKRDTVWAITIGLTTHISTILSNQGFVQKFLALPSLKEGRKASFIFAFGVMLINFTSILIGLLMYANYKDNDPFSRKVITKLDELLPYYVLDVAGKIPGLPGLFIAGIVCAALSTLSATLNSLAASSFNDFVMPFLPKGTTEKTISNYLKMIVLIIGILCTTLVYAVEHLGGLLSLQLSFNAITLGPALGLFTFGMLVPSGNRKGALVGVIGAVLFMSWIVVTSQYYKVIGVIKYPTKPFLDNHKNDSNITNFNADDSDTYQPFFMYRITHYYYSTIGLISMIIIGVIASKLWKDDLNAVHPDLIAPMSQRFLSEDSKKLRYYPVKMANEQLKEELTEKDLKILNKINDDDFY